MGLRLGECSGLGFRAQDLGLGLQRGESLNRLVLHPVQCCFTPCLLKPPDLGLEFRVLRPRNLRFRVLGLRVLGLCCRV